MIAEDWDSIERAGRRGTRRVDGLITISSPFCSSRVVSRVLTTAFNPISLLIFLGHIFLFVCEMNVHTV